jgi:heme-degrading monooxygenase HmoA
MIYEVRFQTIDPERRSDYFKVLRQGIKDMKLAGCRRGQILCSEDDPSRVLVLLEWESREHHLRWRGTPPHTRFRAAVEGGRFQTKPSRGGYYLAETI